MKIVSNNTSRIHGDSNLCVRADGNVFKIEGKLHKDDIETLYAALVKYRRDGRFTTQDEYNLIDVAQHLYNHDSLPKNYGDYICHIPSVDDVKQLNTVTELLTKKGIGWDLQHKGDGIYKITLHPYFGGNGKYTLTFEKTWSVNFACGEYNGTDRECTLDEVVAILNSLRVPSETK